LKQNLQVDYEWEQGAIDGMRGVERGRRSRLGWFDLRFVIGETIKNAGEETTELPWFVFDGFEFPLDGAQPGDVRMYCAPVPEGRAELEKMLLGGPYEGCPFIVFTLSRVQTHSPAAMHLSEEAFVKALAHEWSELHSFLNPDEDDAEDDGGESEEKGCECGGTTRLWRTDDEGDDVYLAPVYCASCGKSLPIDVPAEVTQ
jgi:hypothetical protein